MDDPEVIGNIIIVLVNVVGFSLLIGMLMYSSYMIVKRSKAKSAYKAVMKKYCNRYGKPDYEASDFDANAFKYPYLFVYNSRRIVVINGVEFPFSAILHFHGIDNVSHQYHSSPVSGLIRGEIGRATIGGDKGFILGAMTAPQYTTEHHKYHIQILTSNPQYSTVKYETSSVKNGEMAVFILEYILSVNEMDRKYRF